MPASVAGLRTTGEPAGTGRQVGYLPQPRCPSWAPAGRALVWPGRTWSREAARAPARTELTRSPTAAHVQPDPPASRHPSGGRHLQRPAPGTSWGETSASPARVLLTPARASLTAACRPAVPRSAYAPRAAPSGLDGPPGGRPRPWQGVGPQRSLGAVVRAPGAHLVDQSRDTPQETRQGPLRGSCGPATPPWTGSRCRDRGREWRRSGREPAAVPRGTWGTTAGPAGPRRQGAPARRLARAARCSAA